jgi:dihydropteroate synthase
MMMGVGNLTELTEVDSAAVNALLIGFCEELRIDSVLTTQVINWAHSSVQEIAIARQLMHHAVQQRVLPKHVDERLLLLRDARLDGMTDEELRGLHEQITDPNFRIFADAGVITVMNNSLFEQGSDAFELFEKMNVGDPSHAFYLGWEMMKATLALQLGKRYVQDQALRFGFLTKEEISHRDRKRGAAQKDESSAAGVERRDDS